ncbi:MAG: ABC transporter ATP-binding protein [Candidatus Woesebacteria bacterium]
MSPIFQIIKFTRKFWKLYIFMGAFVVTISLLSLVSPLLFKQIVDTIVAHLAGNDQDMNRIYWLLGAIVAADIFSTTLTAVGQWIGDQLGEKLQTHLNSEFYKHVLSLHIGYFDNEITGKITNKMTRGIQSITDFIQNMLNNFLPFFLTAFVTIILLAHYSVIIAVLLAALFPLYIVISHKSTLMWGKFSAKENAIKDTAQGRVYETLVGIRVVKAFTGAAEELRDFLSARHQVEKIAKEKTKIWHAYDFLRRLMLNVILFGIIAYIVYWTFHGRYTIGEMTLLIQLVNQARFPLFAMSFILGQIQQASSGSKDFFEVLATKTEIKDHPGATPLEARSSRDQGEKYIEFDKVSFGYGDKNVLEGITFHIKEGNKLALVGESGQGKSTIVNLLLRFYEPNAGAIRINGQDILQVTETSLHQNIAVVFQESLLFSGTIIDNIRYGRPDASEADVIEAAKAANAHQFIEALPDGYKSVTGERGVKLSGGQKQRVAIARAMLTDAPIIILDEATSALDSKSELEVQKGLERLLHGRTSIIIAHRLSTIANADHILVLSGGKVAEQGTSTELLKKKNGLYRGLVELQSQLLKAPGDKDKKTKELQKFDLVG